jgi:hypothetical protein
MKNRRACIAIGAMGAMGLLAGFAGAAVTPAAAAPADSAAGAANEVQIDARTYTTDASTCVTLPAPGAAEGHSVTNRSTQNLALFGSPDCSGVPVAVIGSNTSSFGVAPSIASFRAL